MKNFYPIFLSINILFIFLSKLNGTDVSIWNELQTAIIQANDGFPVTPINFSNDINYSDITRPLGITKLFGYNNFEIIIDGQGKQFTNNSPPPARGFMALGNGTNHTIKNLTFLNSTAKGGDGGRPSGGGGAGVGGALFIQRGVTLTIENIHFENCSAIGGSGAEFLNETGGGGGGGLHGDGGNTPMFERAGSGGGAFDLGKGGNAGSDDGGGGSGSGQFGFDANTIFFPGTAGGGGNGFSGGGGGTPGGGPGSDGGGGGGGNNSENGGDVRDPGGGGAPPLRVLPDRVSFLEPGAAGACEPSRHAVPPAG